MYSRKTEKESKIYDDLEYNKECKANKPQKTQFKSK